ncbi:thioesterase family protein [Diaphorobacter sp. HDW4A]|uniref:acyl-CoA thioesterase n=1 Tax=Diaphorobacter sp. HDW4A TaxID=2714924 RepID=UPI00140729F7|nr:thioesterase family protein [Diaphorobacter sp. HDW4A]QIL81798.1 thioesterase family protein [Diaphorobacter sp. HDW4A]
MTNQATIHPLDDALLLETREPGIYTGRTTDAYWNMVGPFGGITAATLLQAVLKHPQLLGDPLSLTVNFAGAVTAGEFTVKATPARTNRSTQHWIITLEQAAANGEVVIATTATAVTAVRRETWSVTDVPMPVVPAPQECQRAAPAFRSQWLSSYEMRPVSGNLPTVWDDRGDTSLSQLWVRDAPERTLDFVGLAAASDVFFPRPWLRRARQVPAGTVSITTYFHASGAQLAQTGNGYLFAQARAQEFRNGFCDQTAQLWNADGLMLATTNQIVYYKE